MLPIRAPSAAANASQKTYEFIAASPPEVSFSDEYSEPWCDSWGSPGFSRAIRGERSRGRLDSPVVSALPNFPIPLKEVGGAHTTH